MTCKAELHISDDFGDNDATMRCQLEDGHSGPHIERYRLGPGHKGAHDVQVEWFGDDAEAAHNPPDDSGERTA